MKVGELIPLQGTKFLSKTTVPAGKAATAALGVLGISFGIKQSTGDTSKSAVPMPKYRTTPRNKQGTM
jgi:hypothetical protein